MKRLLWICIGFVLGILYRLYRDILSLQPQPQKVHFQIGPLTSDTKDRILAAAITALEAQEKTQPLEIEEEQDGPNVWDPDYMYLDNQGES